MLRDGGTPRLLMMQRETPALYFMFASYGRHDMPFARSDAAVSIPAGAAVAIIDWGASRSAPLVARGNLLAISTAVLR